MVKTKYLLIAIVLGVAFFTLGFYANKPPKDNESLKTDTILTNTQTAKNDIYPEQSSASSKKDYAKILKGKFILESSDYAGYHFIDTKTISWTNEMFPMDPDTLHLKWIDENTFITKSIKRTDKNCAPAISILKVVSYDGYKLVLKDYWTGWNDRKDELNTFHQSKD